MIAELFFFLIAAHALCDYPLQGDFLWRAKNINDKTISVSMGKWFWFHALSCHALIHGGAVAIITGFWWIGLFETVCHWLIDYGKCQKKYNIHIDQLFHILCKIVWVWLTLISIDG